MAIPILDEEQRKYPLKQPEGWQPPVPRYTLRFPDDVRELAVANVGIQSRDDRPVNRMVVDRIEKWSTSAGSPPLIVEKLSVVFGRDQPDSLVFVCYWTSKKSAEIALQDLNLGQVFQDLSTEARQHTGLWFELFTPDISHFETHYSGTDYQPGLAQLAGSKQNPHNLTGYWGAARDRIRASAYERLDDTDKESKDSVSISHTPPNFNKATLSKHIRGSNTRTLAHIRSGQFWENCSDEETQAYEEKLEVHLHNGLRDILEHPIDKGDFGLRFLRNVPTIPQSYPRKETCASSFFRSLHDLEDWAKNCPSHHKIYGGSISHKKRFGDKAMMRTWHEVSILRPGEVKWEYVNCASDTGILPFVQLDDVKEIHV